MNKEILKICHLYFREESFRTGWISYEIRCNTPNVLVRSSEQSDALIACEAAREAIEFQSSQGNPLKKGVGMSTFNCIKFPTSESPKKSFIGKGSIFFCNKKALTRP